MDPVQIVTSTWFLPGWIGIIIGMVLGAGVAVATRWAMDR